MSDKLVVEFYDLDGLEQPVASVLAFYGGDNPSVAATTLTDFFDAITSLAEPSFNDAALLAARFVVWQSARWSNSSPLDFTDVTLVPFGSLIGYQVARVYARQTRPYVYFPTNEWTSADELYQAALILQQQTVASLTPA